MPTNFRSETRAISIAADPDTVFAFLAEPTNIPTWAPAFAQSIRADGDGWVVSSEESEFRIIVRASAEQRTVDLLPPSGQPGGAFAHILANDGGSEFLFTLLLPEGMPAAAVERQMQTVEEELRTVREHCARERRP